MDETNGNKSDLIVILAVLIVVLIIAGVLYLFYRVPS
jgi:flagellar basal body-associated protein FliL